MSVGKRATLLLLALALVAGGTGCASAPGVEAETPAETSAQEEPACAPWQRAYLSLLGEICAREAAADDAAPEGQSSSYSLYDVDKDGSPELFLRYGTGEADNRTEGYTCRDGAAVSLGTFESGHTALYTWPGENAFVYVWGHMGVCFMDKISIAEGKLTAPQEIFSENFSERPDSTATRPGEVVPGSVRLNTYRTRLRLPACAPLTLPIYDYGRTRTPQPGDAAQNRAVRAAVAEVLAGARRLYGVSADGFGGDTGWQSFEDYCQPGVVDLYADRPSRLQKTTWTDLNQDGQDECLLQLSGRQPPEETQFDQYVILSLQREVVYAYCLNYDNDYVLGQDSVFYNRAYGWAFAVSFSEAQCYAYDMPYDADAPWAVWQTR